MSAEYPPPAPDHQRLGRKSLTDVEPVSDVLPADLEPAPKRPQPGFLWSLLWCFGFLIIQVVAGLLPASVIVFLQMVRSGDPQGYLRELGTKAGGDLLLDQLMAPALFLSQIFVITFSLLVLRLVIGKGWTRHIGLRLPALKHVVLALVGLPALSLLGGVVGALAREHLWGFHKLNLDAESQIAHMATLPLWFLILMVGVGPGIGEELWFRGFLGRGLVGRYGILVGVLITSFFFGAMHLDPPQACGAAVLGLGLHLVYLATRSILVPMLLHFLNNSLAVLALTHHASLFDAITEIPPASPLIYHVFFYAAYGALLAAVGWALYRSRARVVPEAGARSSWSPPFPGVEYPPAHSDAIVIRPGPGRLAVGLLALAIAGLAAVLILARLAAASPPP